MNSPDRPPIPDAPPDWPPNVLAYAHPDGTDQYARLIKHRTSDGDIWFEVGAGNPRCPCSRPTDLRDCPVVGAEMRAIIEEHPEDIVAVYGWPHCLLMVVQTDDESRAWAEYHRQAELLCHRDGGGEGEG